MNTHTSILQIQHKSSETIESTFNSKSMIDYKTANKETKKVSLTHKKLYNYDVAPS